MELDTGMPSDPQLLQMQTPVSLAHSTAIDVPGTSQLPAESASTVKTVLYMIQLFLIAELAACLLTFTLHIRTCLKQTYQHLLVFQHVLQEWLLILKIYARLAQLQIVILV